VKAEQSGKSRALLVLKYLGYKSLLKQIDILEKLT
jgi:hypothetical protein